MDDGMTKGKIKGRGAQYNPINRFEKVNLSKDEAEDNYQEEDEKIDTQFYQDHPKKIVNKVNSPDVGMFYSLNPYQGCEHGCIYCYARNTHEYWGWSAGLDFESRIIIKRNAPELLKKHFRDPKWEPYPISISGNTDCYQPIEKKMELTRQLLQVCLEFRHPVALITKNSLILRDKDILGKLAAKNLVQVHFTVTTLDEDLRRAMEPRTAHHKKRLNTIKTLSNAGIPVDILLAPVIPGLNDHEIPDILRETANHGARSADYTIVRLNGPIGNIFEDWINKYFPNKTDKVLNQIKASHGGKVNDSRWGKRMKGEGQMAKVIHNLFAIHKRKNFSDKAQFEFNFQEFCGAAAQRQLDLFQ